LIGYPARDKWKDLKSIMLCRRKRVERDTTTVSTHCSISSLALDAGEAARTIRGHWSRENNPRWYLGVCFGKDAGRARRNHAAENLNTLRKITYSISYSYDKKNCLKSIILNAKCLKPLPMLTS
jgi:predicted transposase YbfD/YdcC